MYEDILTRTDKFEMHKWYIEQKAAKHKQESVQKFNFWIFKYWCNHKVHTTQDEQDWKNNRNLKKAKRGPKKFTTQFWVNTTVAKIGCLNGVCYAAFNSISVISRRQLILFMSSLGSPELGWGSEVSRPRTLPRKTPRGSSAAWIQDDRDEEGSWW